MPTLLPIVAIAAILTWLILRSRNRSLLSPQSTAEFYRSDPLDPLSGRAPDFVFIDEHLHRWDQFAQGANELLLQVQQHTPRFNAELAHALREEPQRSLGRAILYPILQVGGFVPLDSALGQALAATATTPPLPRRDVSGHRYFFAGDLYTWWENYRSAFEPVALYDSWRERPFAREVAIPLFQSATREPPDRVV